jgi:hypothetical protein
LTTFKNNEILLIKLAIDFYWQPSYLLGEIAPLVKVLFLLSPSWVNIFGLPDFVQLSSVHFIDIYRKVHCSSFVLCPLQALPFPKAFLWQPLTVLTIQTRQAVCPINQSIFLRCIWYIFIVKFECLKVNRKWIKKQKIGFQMCAYISFALKGCWVLVNFLMFITKNWKHE